MNFNRTYVGYQGRKKYASENATNTIVTGNGGNVLYTIIGGGESTGTTIDAYTKAETDALLADKQDVLVSGNNIKTINGESILGGGDISIQGSNLVITPVADELFDYTYMPKVGIGQKEVAKVINGDTTFYLSSIDRENYRICLYKQPAHTRADFPITGLAQDLLIRFENYDTRLEGNNKYRLCLMEWRRDKKKCWHWSIPMLTPRWDSVTGTITHSNTSSRYAFEETFCPVAGQETKMFGTITGKTWADILPLDVISYISDSGGATIRKYRFKNGRSNRIFGFALFRLFEPNTEGYVGRYEWARVSNIAKMKVTVDRNGEMTCRVLND